MYTYRKLKIGEVISKVGNTTLYSNSKDWAVFNSNGMIDSNINPISGRKVYSVFKLEESARLECEHQNSLLQK